MRAKNFLMGFWINESERRAVDLLAARRDINTSELMRALIREEAARAALPDFGLLNTQPEPVRKTNSPLQP